jgi:hypothetical protein
VFANSNCGSSEAQFLMDINRKKSKTETARIIQIKGASTRDHFTVTYTDEDGRTSELSSCVTAAQYADGDGDGSIDPFDEVFGAADNPGVGVYATDNESLCWRWSACSTRRPGPVGDEQLGSSPTTPRTLGWLVDALRRDELPHHQRRARQAHRLALAIVDPTDPPRRTAYWKYGPRPPEPSDVVESRYDAASDTGVVVTDAADMPYIGITRALASSRRRPGDRRRRQPTITDPGAPVLGAPNRTRDADHDWTAEPPRRRFRPARAP